MRRIAYCRQYDPTLAPQPRGRRHFRRFGVARTCFDDRQHPRPRGRFDHQRADRRRESYRGIALPERDYPDRFDRVVFVSRAEPRLVHDSGREDRLRNRRASGRRRLRRPVEQLRDLACVDAAHDRARCLALERQFGSARNDQRRLFDQRRRTKGHAVGCRFGFAQSSLRRDRERARRVDAVGAAGLVPSGLHSRRRLRSSGVRVRRRTGRAAIRFCADRYALRTRTARGASLHRRHARNVELDRVGGLHQSSHQDRNVAGLCECGRQRRRAAVLSSGLGRGRRFDAGSSVLVLRGPGGRRPRLSLHRPIQRRRRSALFLSAIGPQRKPGLFRGRRQLLAGRAALQERSELRREVFARQLVLPSQRRRSRKRDELPHRDSA